MGTQSDTGRSIKGEEPMGFEQTHIYRMWYTHAIICNLQSTYETTSYILQFLLVSLGREIIIPDLINIGKKA